MPSVLSSRFGDLAASDESKRLAAAVKIYSAARTPAVRVVLSWWTNDEFYSLLYGSKPSVTVGLAVERETFQRIREASGLPQLTDVPPDQDAEEFELHFAAGDTWVALTPKKPVRARARSTNLAHFPERAARRASRATNACTPPPPLSH